MIVEVDERGWARSVLAFGVALLAATGSVLAEETDTPPVESAREAGSAPAIPGEDEGAAVEARPENFVDVRAGSLSIEEIVTEGDLPTAGYEPSPVNGAFLQTPSGLFRLQIGAFAQVRLDSNWRDASGLSTPDQPEQDVTRTMSLRRTQLFLEGKYTERTAYHIRLSVTNSTDFELTHAWGELRLGEHWHLRVGKQVIPLAREDWMLPQDLLTSEQSPNSARFGIGTSIGAFLHRKGHRHRLWLAYHNGAFGGRNAFPVVRSGPAASTRWEWSLVGDDWTVWSDMVGRRGRSRAIMLGMSAAYQGEQTQQVRAAQYNVDLNLNGDGYQAVVSTSGTHTSPDGEASFWTYGLVAQAGVFVSSGGQVFAQYNLVHPGSAPRELEAFHSLTFGFNYFPFQWTNRWKLSAETGWLFSATNRTIVKPSGSLGFLPSDEAGQLYVRLQLQLGF